MDYKFITDLLATAEVPNESIHRRVLQKDEDVNITLFVFSAGQELSTHSAPTPAVICILNGAADISLGEDVHHAKASSFAYVPPAPTRDCCKRRNDYAPHPDEDAAEVAVEICSFREEGGRDAKSN